MCVKEPISFQCKIGIIFPDFPGKMTVFSFAPTFPSLPPLIFNLTVMQRLDTIEIGYC